MFPLYNQYMRQRDDYSQLPSIAIPHKMHPIGPFQEGIMRLWWRPAPRRLHINLSPQNEKRD